MTRREVMALLGAPLAVPEGSVLVHEHVLVDFAGADKITPGRYDPEEVFRVARPKLEEIRKLGCRRFLECTPNFLGRDAKLLAHLSDAVGLEIWTNTGIYGAGGSRLGVPAFAWKETAEQLARRWIAEARKGIDGVKPRFIKTGVKGAPLEEIDRKLVRASAITSRETGLAIASHTGSGGAALEQLDILASEKVSAAKFVWVHAQNEKDHGIHEKVARAGAWVEFDGIRAQSAAWHLECLELHGRARAAGQMPDLTGRRLVPRRRGGGRRIPGLCVHLHGLPAQAGASLGAGIDGGKSGAGVRVVAGLRTARGSAYRHSAIHVSSGFSSNSIQGGARSSSQ